MLNTRLHLVAFPLAIAVLALAACGGDDTSDKAGGSGPTGPAKVDGKFDVGGHSLYLKCRGAAPPTIIYMHGSITQANVVPHTNGTAFLSSLGDEHRVCVYDRRNLGRSDKVDAPQLPKDALSDMRRLLAAADVKPPYVLLGASFGGLPAYLYANTYPDEVVGMVLLDSMFPDALSLEHLVTPEDRYEASDAEDENESLERISHYKVLKASQPYIGKEPAIPVTYLSSIPESDAVIGQPEYDKRILKLQEAYVKRFSPGRYLRVDAPHFMEAAIPEQITKELRRVIASADTRSGSTN
jgi:pimeloyl-ACP methyl ester carboxylesterase